VAIVLLPVAIVFTHLRDVDVIVAFDHGLFHIVQLVAKALE
jgi:hypothetical protein